MYSDAQEGLSRDAFRGRLGSRDLFVITGARYRLVRDLLDGPLPTLAGLTMHAPLCRQLTKIHRTERLEDGQAQLQLGLRWPLTDVSELMVELHLRYL
jgi:hypothetical protein